MSGLTSRKNAIIEITNRAPKVCEMPGPLNKIWATDVFNLAAMEEALSKNTFKAIKKTVQTCAPLDPAKADVVDAKTKA